EEPRERGPDVVDVPVHDHPAGRVGLRVRRPRPGDDPELVLAVADAELHVPARHHVVGRRPEDLRIPRGRGLQVVRPQVQRRHPTQHARLLRPAGRAPGPSAEPRRGRHVDRRTSCGTCGSAVSGTMDGCSTPRSACCACALLPTRPSWSGPELAERLGVTTRTVRNDVERLRLLGYEVRSSPGVAGGYRLGSGTALPPLLLDDEEATVVAVALRAAAAGSVSGVEDVAGRTLVKLDTVLPARLRARAD